MKLMRTFNLLFLPVLLLFWLPKGHAQQSKDTEQVLFVGNSLTFFWNMPQMVSAMAATQGISLEAAHSTVGGSNLEQHWKGEKNTQTRKRMDGQKWDRIIFGDHSRSTIDAPERFREYSSLFVEEARKQGAEPLLYLTWAYKSNPLMQDQITRAYLDLGKELNCRVVPAGPLWEQARQLRPDLELFFDDKHPSPDGAYLTALLFYKVLTGKPVSGLPDRLQMKTDKGETLYLVFVLPETGDFLRNLVDRFDVSPYNFTRS